MGLAQWQGNPTCFLGEPLNQSLWENEYLARLQRGAGVRDSTPIPSRPFPLLCLRAGLHLMPTWEGGNAEELWGPTPADTESRSQGLLKGTSEYFAVCILPTNFKGETGLLLQPELCTFQNFDPSKSFCPIALERNVCVNCSCFLEKVSCIGLWGLEALSKYFSVKS